MKKLRNTLLLLILVLAAPSFVVAQSNVPGSEVIGRWDLTIVIEGDDLADLGLFRHGLMDSSGFPGWLEMNLSGLSTLVGRYVGYEGSARPISEVHYSAQTNKYHFTIPPQWMDIDDLYFEFSLKDDKLSGTMMLDGHELVWTGVRAPELTREKSPIWGSPKNLLDENLSRWIIPENNKFKMVDGILTNPEVGSNLVTNERFDDFKLSVEFRYPKGSNSGIYLRGRYEVQIEDSPVNKPSTISIGSIYGFIEPSVYAAKKAGEWQTYEITLVGRNVTIVHNGIEVISNRPIPGITGGSLDSKEGTPGPIIIQGDHGPIEFRKFVITPAMN